MEAANAVTRDFLVGPAAQKETRSYFTYSAWYILDVIGLGE